MSLSLPTQVTYIKLYRLHRAFSYANIHSATMPTITECPVSLALLRSTFCNNQHHPILGGE